MWGKGLLTGMIITMKNLLRGPITLKYPYEKLDLPERARWSVHPKFDEAGDPKCTACLACVRQCPDYILDMEVTTAEDKSKHIEHFRYELGACMMCGLCVEACPFDAIEMSHDYELAVTDAAALKYDLLTDVDAASPRKNRPTPAPKPAAAPVSPGEDSAGSSASGPNASAAEDPEQGDGGAAAASEPSTGEGGDGDD